MSVLEKARSLFREEGLAFPNIPKEAAAGLTEKGEWIFSTREIEISPYNLHHYVQEFKEKQVGNYVLLAHSGHGVNSYAVQYYFVDGPLGMFLHLGWGGAYSKAKGDAAQIRKCFFLADQIVAAAPTTVGKFQPGDHLTIVASDFYGSHWLKPGDRGPAKEERSERPGLVVRLLGHWLGFGRGDNPKVVLSEVLRWLRK